MDHIIRKLYVSNNSAIPVYLEDLDLIILPGHFVDLYRQIDDPILVENSKSLEVALDVGLLEIVENRNMGDVVDGFSAQSLESDWTQMYMQIASVGTSSYTVLEPIELQTTISKRTSRFQVRIVNTGGG